MTTQVLSRPRSDAERRLELRKQAAAGNVWAQAHLLLEEVARNDGAIKKRQAELARRTAAGQPRTA